MHHYKHHIGDYRRDTGHLTLLEHGCYRQLLDMYYLSEEPIALETETVMRRLCARTDDEKNAVISVLNEFFHKGENGYVHTRCDVEIATYQAKAEGAREAGKLGGRPKKTDTVISENQSGLETEPSGKLTTNHKPLTTNQEPIKEKAATPPGFAEFWSAYPKKQGKGAAESAWKKHKPNLDIVLAAIAKAKLTEQWQKNGGEFIPNPATWLNQKRWEDEYTPATQTTQCGKPWFLSSAGIEQEAIRLGVVQKAGELFPIFKHRVYQAAGVTEDMVRHAQQEVRA